MRTALRACLRRAAEAREGASVVCGYAHKRALT